MSTFLEFHWAASGRPRLPWFHLEKLKFFEEKLDDGLLPRSQNPVKAGSVSSPTATAARSGLYWIFECGRCCLFLVVVVAAAFRASSNFIRYVFKALASTKRSYPHPPPTALNWIARRRAWITPTQKPCIKYKKGGSANPLIYIGGHDQFLRVFVQYWILFAQNFLVNLSELVQSAVRVRSIKGFENEQR